MKQLKFALIAMFFMVAFSSNAQDNNNPWSIGMGLNSVDIKSGDLFKDWVGFKDNNVLPALSRISVGRYLDYGLSAELSGSLNKIEKGYNYKEGDAKLDDTFLAIDGRLKYHLNELIGKGWFDPYLQAGVGYSKIGSADGFKALGGLGFNTWFNENVGLNFQSAYAHDFQSKLTSYFQHSVGLTFKFGGVDTDGDGIYDKDDACPDVPGLPEFNGCPDTDGDGIPDSKDACPDVPGLAQFNGCPDTDGDGIPDKDDECPNEPGTKANRGCPDTDGDGIIDKEDKCPNEPGPKSNQGCPIKDTDGDGVPDDEDDCPNEAGPASNKGCPEVTEEDAEKLNELFKPVLFEIGKSALMPKANQILDEAAAIINKYPTAKFTISGHTDSTGSKERNHILSEDRANAVKNYLVSKGVSASNLTIKGYASDVPVAPNTTKSGRTQNRRASIKLAK